MAQQGRTAQQGGPHRAPRRLTSTGTATTPSTGRLPRSSAMFTVNWPLRFRNSLVPSRGSTHQLYW